MKKGLSLVLKVVLVLGLCFLLITVGLNILISGSLYKTTFDISRKSIKSVADSVMTVCNTALDTSIQNYLRAQADSGWDIANYYNNEFLAGRLTESEARSRAAEAMLTYVIGDSGYMYGLDISNPDKEILTVIHPVLSSDTNVVKHQFAKDIADMKNGYMEYDWKNPGEEKARAKSTYCRYFEPWDIVLCASAYTEEFFKLIDVSMFREDVLSIRVADNDYATITSGDGTVIVHPALEGKNVYNLKDANGRLFIQDMINDEDGEGWLEYDWIKDKEDGEVFRKIGYFRYLEELDWYVLVTSYEEDILKDARNLTKTIFYALCGVSVFVVLLTFVFIRFLLGPLRKLNVMMSEIASGGGDLTARLQVKFKDEVGTLSFNVNRFMETLQDIVSGVKDKTSSAMNLSRSLTESAESSSSRIQEISGNLKGIQSRFGDLNNNIQGTSSSTEQISRTVSSLAKLIEEQAAAINESSATIEEISGSINNIAKIATAKESTALELVEVTNLGGTHVSETNNIIQGITSEVDSIQAMVEMINGIADQTNLLAMNAAIEAAHAGDAGKGFSVVADEIRKLSETTAENSRQISGNIQSVTEKVQAAMELSNKTDNSFSRIHDEVQATSSAFAEISNAMKELGISSTEILKAVASMNTITSQVRTGAEEMESGAEGINQSMYSLKNFSSTTLGELQQIADYIGDIKDHFQTVSRLSADNQEHLESISDSLSEFTVE